MSSFLSKALALPENQQDQLIAFLQQWVTPNKLARMTNVMELRTQFLTVVIEDIFQPHNASAVLRSCECFGVQSLHVVENKYKFAPNRDVAMGAQNWVELIRYNKTGINNSIACINSLKSQGYQIVATCLSDKAIPLPSLDLSQKTALCFGTEELGLSTDILSAADAHVTIPMFGFTQSFNISVSAALCLHDLRTRLQASATAWQLTPGQRRRTWLLWLSKSIRNSNQHLQHFLSQ